MSQAASWLSATPGGLEDCLQEADLEDLRELLTNQSRQLGRATAVGTEPQNKRLLAQFKAENLFVDG